MAKPRKRGGFLSEILPEKEDGRHRWVLSAVYPLRGGEAAAMSGGAHLNLDPERFVVVPMITCADCNDPFVEAKDEPCRAGDAWRAIEPVEETTDAS